MQCNAKLTTGQDKDNNQNFVRIQKFAPRVENGRTSGTPWKRFTIIGNDNSRTTFALQFPYLRHFRREERTMQVFRTLNLYVSNLTHLSVKLRP